MRKSELLRVHGPDALSFVLRPDESAGFRRVDGGVVTNAHSIFIEHIVLGKREKVCDVPDGFHRSLAADMCPFFRGAHSWFSYLLSPKRLPETCFDLHYESDMMSALDPDMLDKEIGFVSWKYHYLAKKNPIYPLWAMSNPKEAHQHEMMYESARESCGNFGLPDWFLEWPEERQDINTFKFPWE